MRPIAAAVALGLMAATGGCAVTQPSSDFRQFRQEDPRSILIVPVMNQSVNVNAAENFLSTLAQPFADRGYYVFPSYMTRRTMEDDGIGDPGLVHAAAPSKLGAIFGCDAALYVVIERWESKTVIISTVTTVDLNYSLKSCKTDAELWSRRQTISYSPQQQNSSGNPLADLIAQAAVSLIEKAAPSYMPLARQANLQAATTPGLGLPAGPYSPNHGKDLEVFRSETAAAEPAKASTRSQ